jgi:hypothetical protein
MRRGGRFSLASATESPARQPLGEELMRKLIAVFAPAVAGLFLFALASPRMAFANDVYLAQAASGSANASSCANALAVSYFNSGSNWTSGTASGTQIGPGTTVHLCGIITTELAFQGSGTSGNVIELLFEPGASVQISPGVDANGAIGLGGNSYILIDGGANTPCGWNTATNVSEGACNGQVEDMLYGSSDATCPGGPCTTQTNTGNLIQGTYGSNIEIRNLQIGPSYVHTSTGNGGNDTGGTGCIDLNNGNNWNIHDNQLHDGGWCVTLAWTGGSSYSGWTVQNNEIYNSSHMLAVAGASGGTLTAVTFKGNYTHNMGNWDTSSDAWHADGIHAYGASGQTLSNLIIANNIMAPVTGADITAQIFTETAFTLQNVYVFNNLLYSGGSGQGNLIEMTTCMSGCYILNNTLDGPSAGSCIYEGSTAPYLIAAQENNAAIGCWYDVSTNAGVEPSYTTLNYNAYSLAGGNTWAWGSTMFNPTCSGGSNAGASCSTNSTCSGGGTCTNISAWQADSGEGSNSLYAPGGLGINTNYTPTSGSQLIGTGTNLTSLCTGSLSGLCTDLAGNARPSTGAWTIGAYQVAQVAPAPPTNVIDTVQQQ